MQQLLILGGGFAGVWAAMSAAAELSRTNDNRVRIVLLSNDDHLTVRPRLYEGANPDMRVPLPPLLEEIGVEFVHSEVTLIDSNHGFVASEVGQALSYERLILATGSQLQTVNIPGAGQYAFSVDTYDAALKLDKHLAKLDRHSANANAVVVVGAGFTGLELVTELRSRLGNEPRLILVDTAEQAGGALGPNLAATISAALSECRIETRLGCEIAAIRPDAITFTNGATINTRTVILCTGLEASPLTRNLGGASDESGRLVVDEMLRVRGVPAVFAAGDTALAETSPGQPSLMSCQHAMPQGLVAGRNAVNDLVSRPMVPYRQDFYATCLDLGRWGAVFSTGWDRHIEKAGKEGKQMKREINHNWIYPPAAALGRAAIFKSIE